MKIKIEWDESRDRYTGKYLGFELDCEDNYTIVSGGEPIGKIEKIRVGAWQQWCILLEDGCYLSPGCTDECREVQRILGSPNHGGKS